jgi:hypothetical protein
MGSEGGGSELGLMGSEGGGSMVVALNPRAMSPAYRQMRR